MSYNFENRRDRYDFFEAFENPLINLTFNLEVPDFQSFCKTQGFPPFHFFLFCVLRALEKSPAFKHRHLDGEVFAIENFFASYTVLNQDQNLNYTHFENTSDLVTFIQRSLEAKKIAETSIPLMNTGLGMTPRDMKNYVFITSIPWLDFTSIQHPVYKFKSADIPSIAWGRFKKSGGNISLPFSVQAHHGFVDGQHIFQLGEKLRECIIEELAKFCP
jgi:chloramphenicol O-acetyltransferase type A